MSTAQPAATLDELLRKQSELEKSIRRSRWLWFVSLALTIVLAAIVGYLHWKTRQALADAAWNNDVTDYNADNDFVLPQIGTIQFLKRGYSILFDSAQYTANGLELSGSIGNPTNLTLSSLTLNFAARPAAWELRDKWSAGGWFFFMDSLDIGKAQVSVGTVLPGSTAPFSVTIPNVKQTKDEPQIKVSFSGERYSYH